MDDFISTAAAEYFKFGQYEKAAEAFEVMKQKYPRDIRVLRYLGISYFKLGELEKAADNLEAGLLIDPKNIATRFYLAETYLVLRRLEDANEAYQLVVSEDPTSRYAVASLPKIELLKKPLEEILEATPIEEPRRWRLETEIGYGYDHNATFNPRDSDLKSLSDQNAGRYNFGVDAGYDLYTDTTWDLDLEYGYHQSLYDDSLRHLNTYSNTVTAALTRLYTLWNFPIIAHIRETLSHVLLNKKFFVFVNSFSTTFIMRPHPNYQVTALYNFSYSEYEDNTEVQDVTGRDGYGNSVILLNTIYLNEAKTLRFTFGYDYLHDEVQGGNFVRDVHGARAVLNFPLLWEIDGEVGMRYRHDDRPRYLADTEKGPRRDDIWDLSFELSRPITERMTLDVFYTYTRAFGKNNSFEYIRSYGGSTLKYEF